MNDFEGFDKLGFEDLVAFNRELTPECTDNKLKRALSL
jgi:hypothetical protein